MYICYVVDFVYMYIRYRTADQGDSCPSTGGLKMVPWPPRNAAVFLQLNTFMERCNDVLELVITIKHFK